MTAIQKMLEEYARTAPNADGKLDVDQLTKTFNELHAARRGNDTIEFDSRDLTPEQWARFFAAMGVNPDGIEL